MRYLAIALVAVLFGIVGAFDYADAIDADTAQKEALEKAITAPLEFPIPWTATVEQRTYYHEQPKVRYYAPRGKQ